MLKMSDRRDLTNRSQIKTNAVTKRTELLNNEEYLTGLSNYHEYTKPQIQNGLNYSNQTVKPTDDIFAQTFSQLPQMNNMDKSSIFGRKIPLTGTGVHSRNQKGRLENGCYTANDIGILTTQNQYSNSE
jgi:hypothetical protein